MKKYLFITLLFSGIFCHAISQSVKLTAVFDFNNSAVKLNWNMVNSNVKTSYLLLRSADGISWTEAAKDRMHRKYTEDDIYFFNDRKFVQGKNHYRLKISDSYNNTIALSPVVTVNTGNRNVTATSPVNNRKSPGTNTGGNNPGSTMNTRPQSGTTWTLYPNPVTDNLKLTYKGPGNLKGVVNVQIQDVTGKIRVKFRSGSMYKTISVPVSQLQRGTYFIQVSVLDEIMMNEKFVKQ